VLLGVILYLPQVFDNSANERSISICVFPNIISPEAIQEFEKQTGITVHAHYFESNEELLAKFKINEGVGYDMVTPSDFMVEILHKDGLLQAIDTKKIKNFKELDDRLLGRYFDSNNKYSVPYCWTVYGIAYDKELFNLTSNNSVSFELIFNSPAYLVNKGIARKPYQVCMTDDGRESVFFAALYLFGRTKYFDSFDFRRIQDTLITQKPWVECYTDASLQYFLVGNIVSAAVIGSNHMKKILALTDRFDFKIPEEGSVLVIENVAIPVHSKKSDLVCQFIDFIISKQQAFKHFELYGNNPSNKSSYDNIDPKIVKNSHLFPSQEQFTQLHLIHNELPIQMVDAVWLKVKFA
jgi:spermidine/putrescine transport system substrate-binding protein